MTSNQQKMSDVILKCLKDPTFLKQFKQDPKEVMEKELNTKLPASYQVEVLQETPQKGYVVIPSVQPVECSEELQAIAAGPVQTSYCTAACKTKKSVA